MQSDRSHSASPLVHTVTIGREGSGPASLRQRKKQLTRQLIADIATSLFLRDGYDNVRIADIAAACGLSTKTVTNYFPTKDLLLFAREEQVIGEIRLGIGQADDSRGVIDVMVAVIEADLRRVCADRLTGARADGNLRLRLIGTGPELSKAEQAAVFRMTSAVEEALRQRFGGSPADMQPVMAAHALVGLWCVQVRAMAFKDAPIDDHEQLVADIMHDVKAAARILDEGWHVPAPR